MPRRESTSPATRCVAGMGDRGRVRRRECSLRQAGSALEVIRLPVTSVPGRARFCRAATAEVGDLEVVRTERASGRADPAGLRGVRRGQVTGVASPGLRAGLAISMRPRICSQSTLDQAAAHWGWIHGAPQGLWCRRIMYREQVGWWRRGARRPEIAMAQVPELPARDEVAGVEARLAGAAGCAAGSSPGKRVMLVLRYLEDLPEAQVADILWGVRSAPCAARRTRQSPSCGRSCHPRGRRVRRRPDERAGADDLPDALPRTSPRRPGRPGRWPMPPGGPGGGGAWLR